MFINTMAFLIQRKSGKTEDNNFSNSNSRLLTVMTGHRVVMKQNIKSIITLSNNLQKYFTRIRQQYCGLASSCLDMPKENYKNANITNIPLDLLTHGLSKP